MPTKNGETTRRYSESLDSIEDGNNKTEDDDEQHDNAILNTDSEERKKLKRRVKNAQKVCAVAGSFGIVFYVMSDFYILLNWFVLLSLLTYCGAFYFIYHNNISLVVLNRVFHEVNVLVVLGLTICNVVVDVMSPHNEFTVVMSFAYVVCALSIFTMDAIEIKSRTMVLTVGTIFSVLTLYNLYSYTFSSFAFGIELYNFGNGHVFYKRSVKRSIYFNICTSSIKGLKNMFKDKDMNLLMFVTDPVYRDTGDTLPPDDDNANASGRGRALRRGLTTYRSSRKLELELANRSKSSSPPVEKKKSSFSFAEKPKTSMMEKTKKIKKKKKKSKKDTATLLPSGTLSDDLTLRKDSI